MEFENLIVEKSFEEMIQLVNNEASLDEVQVWPSFYGEKGTNVEKSTEENINILVDMGILEIVELDPKQIFDIIYKVKNYDETFSMVYIFKRELINVDKMLEQFEENSEDYKIENYIADQKSKYSQGEFKQEKIDVMGMQETQDKIDAAEERYKNGEINLGEKYKEIFGDEIEYDNDKVIALINDIVNNQLSFEDMYNKMNNQQFNRYEVDCLNDLLKKEHADIQERFNEESEEYFKKVAQQQKDELNKAIEAEKERIEKLTEQDWYYTVEIDENKTPTVTLIPKEVCDKGEKYEDEVPFGILKRFIELNITKIVSNNQLTFDESKMWSKPSIREITNYLSQYENMIYIES